MQQDRVEEYLGAIYRLRGDAETPVPLSQLAQHFGFSPVSVHEMVQKLNSRGSVRYHPYRGVTLTEMGEEAAMRLLRRHRLWERFLTDILEVAWDEAHEIAGRLEHVATELVTDRLAAFLGDPQACPHGAPIPPQARSSSEVCLRSLREGAEAYITRIAPEVPALLQRLLESVIVPGRRVQVLSQSAAGTEVLIAGAATPVRVPAEDAGCVWLELIKYPDAKALQEV
ncbi:MAG: metal-dependent transcriptional regulator [Anaerolineae bacterium]|nr:metal-dependent transcriptional regulator [Anaerolineae bacterium]